MSLSAMRMGNPLTAWPDRLLAAAYVRRAAGFWAAIHAFFLIVSGGTVISLDPLAALALAAISGWLGVFDARRRGEMLLLRNLGVDPALVAAIWIGVTLLLEAMAYTLAAALPG